MPELPEVETTVSLLQKEVLRRTFVRIWAEKERKDLLQIIGQRIEGIRRYGKTIHFLLSDDSVLFVHLRMTGHFLLGEWDWEKGDWRGRREIMREKRNGFLRYVFFLDDERQLALSDARKFAKVSLLSKEEAREKEEKLGPDALEVGKEKFFSLLEGRKGEIKPLLMQQELLAGVGNIYAAEILFRAGIHPKKKAHLLSTEEKEKIFQFMKIILKRAIDLRGDSASDYRTIYGEKGGYQKEHLVYSREGMPCVMCEGKIKRAVIGGRGTYFCPKCQAVDFR